MRDVFLGLLCLTLISNMGCKESENKSGNSIDSTSCKGEWTFRDQYGDLKKKKEYFHEGMGACVTEYVALSNFEKSSESRRKNNISCESQAGFPAISMKAANNLYTYRNDKVYLSFDSNGEYRKIVFGEDSNGNQVYSRTLGCYWQRTGEGVDTGFGDQLYLDGPRAASSDLASRNEIFRYNIVGDDIFMTRYDNVTDWSLHFCPYLNTPWEFCEEIRNGNIMFWPDLPVATQSALLNEAILIRTQYNYIQIADGDFENLWTSLDKDYTELDQGDWLYYTVHLPDEPGYTWQAWRDYVTGDRPTMPDVTSPTAPPVCYDSLKEVILSDATTAYLNGEVCYIGGEYVFTEN